MKAAEEVSNQLSKTVLEIVEDGVGKEERASLNDTQTTVIQLMITISQGPTTSSCLFSGAVRPQLRTLAIPSLRTIALG